ncbi:hypothetical protein [Streptomyces sp. NPDC097619]|uniref:hypothetical protein n=1 Tax=Streptomyces sp. NPDC097619 TaxID=3157228 RepID=UPI00331A2967
MSAPGDLRADGAPAGGGPARDGDPAPAPRRRTATVDPVKVLLHHHQDLCARAVDPLEIAAGLEARGVTDRTAARFRHRDVFSLAEELYARVPRPAEQPSVPGPPDRAPRPPGPAALAAALLPGVLGTAALHLPPPGPVLTAVWAAVGLAALWAALRTGPLRAPAGPAAGRAPLAAAALATVLLIGYGWYDSAATGAAVALSLGPATLAAGLFGTAAAGRLAASRSLDEFSAAARPLLLGTTGLYAAALAGLLVLTGGDLLTGTALGCLLHAARLLRVRGLPVAAALGAACAAEAAARALGLPGAGLAAAALAVLAHATLALSRASAHARP